METLIDRLRAVRAFRNLPVSVLTKIAQIASPPHHLPGRGAN
ncbi:hypothetical protein OF390_08550 [Limosilactobacillus fermentum]|nr:hypothetical protein [Limosilactobacillus fermentum]MCV3756013.1 hypothetical protein [Limosilactobacillus fermentum]